jgi:septal ring factor EnvC (AmiA/AmiB activator)
VDEKDRITQTESFTKALVLSRKMGLTVTTAKNIRRQLDKIWKALKEEENMSDEVQNAIKSFEEKFYDLENEVVPKGIGLRSSREESLRGGSIARRITSMVGNLGGFPFPPSSTELHQLKELEKVIEVYIQKVNSIIEEDIPALNKTLEAHNVKPIKPPKKVE